ncbi:MAG: exodeoxyribonuclease V subunit gamma [Enterobacterales bacterium]
MFIIYHSNSTDMLEIIISLLISFKKKNIDPLKPEIIVVKNNNISKWIKIKLSKQLSICSNIKFMTISKFIWKMISNLLNKNKNEYIFNQSIMTWKIMSLIPNIKDDKYFLKIKLFLNNNDILKKFKFSNKLSYIFNQYLIYRPDWLKCWIKGKLINGLNEDQIWQSLLWRKLIKNKLNYNKLILKNYENFNNIKKIIEKENKKDINLPNRAFIFGISSLPPIYIKLLELLGNYMDIHNMFINPCKYYWGDIEDFNFFEKLFNKYIKKDNKINSLTKKIKKNSLFLNYINKPNLGNYLLSSYGNKCKEYIFLISNLNRIIEINAFIKPVKNNILNLIKKDILFLKNYSFHNKKKIYNKKILKRIIKIKDYSININACSSYYKEIEILYDKLLLIMSKDLTLKPQDIIVMATDINNYIPSIKSIFGNYNLKNNLPFYISDIISKKINIISKAFIKLLDLPFMKLSSKEILKFLEVKSISYKFNINNKEIDILKKWIFESGIKLDLDEEKNNQLISNVNNFNTWNFGLNRMFLGYSMKSKYGYWNKILPYDKTYGLSSILLGNFYNLISNLKYFKKILLKPKKIKYWFSISEKIISSFFCSTSYKEENVLMTIKSKWKKVLKYCLKSKFKEKISIKLIKEELFNKLKKEKIINNFLFGKINFCNLKSMSSINFRIVCILGINDNIVKYNDYKNNFNLIYKHPRIGDKKIENYKYLFLESIMSSKEIFYVSFIGNNIKNNNINTPSMFINELIDYISNNFYIEGDQYLDEKKIINNVIKHIFEYHDKKFFLNKNIFFLNKKTFYLKKNLSNLKNDLSFNSKLLLKFKNKIIKIEDIIAFYKNPIKTWFIKNIGIYFDKPFIKFSYENENFNNILTNFKIKEKILNLIIKKKNIIKIFNEIKYSGLLPYGIFGEIFFLEQYNKLINLYKKIKIFNISKKKYLEICLNFKNITIIGWIYHFNNNGIIKWSPKKKSIKDGLLLWIEHLIYCASGGKGSSIMFFINGEWNFIPIKKIKAKNLLIYYILGYFKGIYEPLLLLYHSSNIWIKYCYNNINKTLNKDINIKNKVKEIIIKYFCKNKEFYSEYNDVYINKVIKNLNKNNIDEIIFLSEKYLLPMLKFNKI